MIAHALILTLALGQFLPDGMQPFPYYTGGGVTPASFVFAPDAGVYPTPITPGAGPAMTFARGTVGTYQPTVSTVASAAIDELRVGYQGALLESGSINYCLNSEAMSAGIWVQFSANVTADTTVAPDGTTTADTLTASDVSGLIFQVVSVPSGVVFSSSTWVKAGTSSTPGAGTNCLGGGNVTSCSCKLSNGEVCSPIISSSQCVAGPSSAPGWVRVDVTVTCTSATTSVFALALVDRDSATTIGLTAVAWGAQIEDSIVPSSYIATAGTAVSRDPDLLSVPASVLGSGSASFQMVMTPQWASVDVNTSLLDSDGDLALYTLNDDLGWFVEGSTATATGPLGWDAGYPQTLNSWYGAATGDVLYVSDGTHTANLPTGGAGPPTSTVIYIGGDSTASAGVSISRLAICPNRTSACN